MAAQKVTIMISKKQIIDFISEQLAVSREECTPTANFINDLGADSFDLIVMLMELETQAQIGITYDEMEKLGTIGDVFSFLERKGLLVD